MCANSQLFERNVNYIYIGCVLTLVLGIQVKVKQLFLYNDTLCSMFQTLQYQTQVERAELAVPLYIQCMCNNYSKEVCRFICRFVDFTLTDSLSKYVLGTGLFTQPCGIPLYAQSPTMSSTLVQLKSLTLQNKPIKHHHLNASWIFTFI